MHPSIEKLLGVQKLDREIKLLEEAKIRRPMELSDDLRKVNAGKASVSAVEEVIKPAGWISIRASSRSRSLMARSKNRRSR